MISNKKKETTIKKRLLRFINIYIDPIVDSAPLGKRIILNLGLGKLSKEIKKMKEEDLEAWVKKMIRDKEEIYKLLEDAKEGRLQLTEEEKQNMPDIVAVLPLLQDFLKKDDNPLKKMVDAFYKEFEDVGNETEDRKN